MWKTLTSNERDDWIITTIIFLIRTIFWWYIYLVCSGAHEQDDYLFISSHSFLFRNKMLEYNSFSSLFGNLGRGRGVKETERNKRKKNDNTGGHWQSYDKEVVRFDVWLVFSFSLLFNFYIFLSFSSTHLT